MKSIKTLLVIAIFMGLSLNGYSQQEIKPKGDAKPEIEVYYSHFNKRCATCNAVENETLKVLKEKYGKQMKEGLITFTSLNLDEKAEKKAAKKLKISGQTLLIVGKGQQVNLTSEGFLNARNNPEKFHDILISKIDKLL